MAWDGFGIRLFRDLIIPAAQVTKTVVSTGNAICQLEKAKQREEKIKEAVKWVSKAENGDYELYEKACESYQDEDFDRAIHYAKQAVEKGERERMQMFED